MTPGGPQGNAMVEQVVALSGPYLGIFLILLACGLGLPLPEDVPLLFSGFLVHKDVAHLALMIPVTMAGVLGGDCVLFSLGRRFGHHIVEHRLFRRVVNPPRLLMAEQLFQRHGIKIVFIGRFLPGLRPMIFMAAGILRVPFSTFLAVNGFAACISVPTLVVLGKFFGHNLDKITSDVRTVTHFIVLAILIGLLVTVGVYLHRRQKRLMAATGVAPDMAPETLAQLPPQGKPLSPEPEPRQDSAAGER